MNKSLFLRHSLVVAILSVVAMVSRLSAQSPSDGTMMTKGQICTAVFYGHDSWDQYWEGTLKRSNGNIGTLTRQSVMPMIALGLTDKINFLAALPWMKTEASAGQVDGVQGFQDWGFWIKGKLVDVRAGKGSFSTLATLGAGFPATKYLADYAPFSLGLGCKEVSLRAIVQYDLDMGLYLRGQAGYHLRGPCTIERDYFYTTQSVYTDKVDMPEAVTYGVTLGSWLLKKSLKVELNYEGLNTLGGFDIRRQDAGFPANKMINTRIGGGIQYYLPFVKGLGVHFSGGYVLTGRNVGQSTAYTAGLSYFFNVWNAKSEEK